MKSNRFIAGLLSVCMLFGTFSVAMAEKTTDNGIAANLSENNIKEAEILSAVGVIDMPEAEKNWDELQLTNGDFIVWAFNLSEYADIINETAGTGSELSKNGEACFNQYAYAESNGWFTEKKDEYRSDKILSAEFAAVVLEGVLGYRRLVTYGITEESSEIQGKVLNGVKVNDGEVTMNGAIKMLYNATDIEVLDLAGASSAEAEYSVRDGITALVKYKKIYKIKGRVNATEIASLNGVTAGKNRIIINDTDFEIQDKSFNSFIGQYINGYAYIDDNDSRILYMMRDKKTDELTIEGEDFVSYDSNVITYYDTTGRQKSVRVDSPVIIYNGKELKNGEYSDGLFDVCDGNITLIQNSNVYNVVIINDYRNIVVDTTDADKNLVYDMLKTGNSIKLDMESNELISLKNLLGANVAFEKLKKGDIITYIASLDGEYIDAVVGGNSSSGMIKSIERDEKKRYKKVKIDDSEYCVSKEMRDSDLMLMLSKEYTFYVNCRGKMVGVAAPDELQSTIGYMTAAWVGDGTDDVYIRIVPNTAVEMSEAISLKCAKRVSIDGTSYKNTKIMDGLKVFNSTTEYPIAYEVNKEGEISTIDTPYYNKGKEPENSMIQRHSMSDEGLEVKETAYWGYRNQIGGKYYLSYEGLCVMKPEGKETFLTERIKSGTAKSDIYTLGKDSAIAYFAVVNDDSESTSDFEEKLAIIDDIYTGLNKDDESVTKIKMIISSKEYEYRVEPNNKQIEGKIGEGDIVRFKLNAKGNIIDFDIVLDYSNIDSSLGYMNATWNESPGFRVVLGKVYDVQKDTGCTTENREIISFYTDENNKESSLETIFLRKAYAYKYDWSGRGAKEIRPASSNDIKTYKSVGEDANYILIATEYTIPLEIYFINTNK